MSIDESEITKWILQKSMEDLISIIDVDAIIVGAGPSGLVAGRYLAKGGLKTVIFERKLSFGGGIGGGGMLLPKVVVQTPADQILREADIKLEKVKEGLFIVDTSTLIAKLASSTLDAGAKLFLGISVEDLVFRERRVVGAVTQWTAVELSGLHVDPLSFKAKAIIDCTGHDAEVLNVAAKKLPELGIRVLGEKSMWVEKGESMVVERTGEVVPGLYVAGIAATNLYQTPRMGPIFGGMLLSGRKVAELVIKNLKKA